MLKITLQQVNTNPTLKLTHTVTAQSKINCYNPVASHHLCIFSKSPDVLCESYPFLVKWVKYFKEKSEERKMEDIIVENKGLDFIVYCTKC